MNFVEKQDTAVRFLDQPRLVVIGTGIGAFDMPEELRQQQLRVIDAYSAQLNTINGIDLDSFLGGVFPRRTATFPPRTGSFLRRFPL